MKHNKGFTLIEMMIVIAIIGILAGMLLTGANIFNSKARDARRIADLGHIQSYMEIYLNKCNRYPGDATCASNNPASWADLTTAMASVMGTSNKFPQPQAPTSTYPYCYGVSADGLTYVLGAVLENDNGILKGSIKTSDLPNFKITSGNTSDCSTTASIYVYWVSS